MRVAFFCSSLERGRDGVGDYSRRLAGELIRRGHASIVTALHDPHLAQALAEQQPIEGTSVPVLRLPSVSSWEQRAIEARKWLDGFNPDWASLQFVPFGFHPKGFCFGLGKSLAAIHSKLPWHIMFHELWLGLGKGASLKHRMWGALQRRNILDLMSCLRPRIVHTQTESYRQVLGREGVQADILPLFGNIPLATGDGWGEVLEPLVTEGTGSRQDRSKFYLTGVFGAVHPEWDPEQAVNTLLPLVRRFQKKLVLIFLGKSNLSPQALHNLKLQFQDRAEVVAVGERTDSDISKILQTLDLALATSPRQVIQKSGSVASMLEHGLPVLVTRDDWHLRGQDSMPEPASPRLLSPKQFALLGVLPARELRPLTEQGVQHVATQLLRAMTSHPA